MKTKLINPSWLNLLIPVSIGVHFLFPIKILIQSPVKYMGVLVIIVGLVLNLAASNHLRNHQTPVKFNRAPIRLVTDGPFRFSRNPIYLSGVLVLTGIALILGSLVSFCFPVILFMILNILYIPSEESKMVEKFGDDYIEYKNAVNRWV